MKFYFAFVLCIFFNLSCFNTIDNERIKKFKLVQQLKGVSVYMEMKEHSDKFKFTFYPSGNSKSKLHLYDTNLPIYGLDGVGRPTLVELQVNEYIEQTGKINVNQKLVESTDAIRFYPSGPVELIMTYDTKVKDINMDTISLTFLITYMACGDFLCMEPVTRLPVNVEMPAAWL